jgi:hypothetical protein
VPARPPSGALATAILLVISALVMLPGLILGPYQDAGIFGTIGEQLARGHLPYRDAWDHKPPGIYLISAIASLLPGPIWPSFWGIAVAWLAATGMVLRRVAGLPVAAIAVISMGLYPVAVGGGETEAFAVLPAIVGFVMAMRDRWVASGVAAGFALLFSAQAAPLLVAIVVFAQMRPRSIEAVVAGLLLPLGAAVASLAAVGILPAAFDAVITYNGVYLGSNRGGDLGTAYYLLVAVVPLAVALPFASSREFDRADGAALAWCAAAGLLLIVQGRLLAHYIIPLAIPLAILARHPVQRRLPQIAVAIATSAMVAVSVFVASREAPIHRGPPSRSVGLWIKEHSQPGDTVLDWGVEAGVYLVSERAPAGRYVYDLPLVTPGYSTQQMVDEWVASLAARPPAIIVDSEAANSYWPDGADFFRPPPPEAAGGRDIDFLQPLRRWVASRYSLAIEIAGRKIYIRSAG